MEKRLVSRNYGYLTRRVSIMTVRTGAANLCLRPYELHGKSWMRKLPDGPGTTNCSSDHCWREPRTWQF